VPNAFVSNDVEIFDLQCPMVLSSDGEDFDLKCRIEMFELECQMCLCRMMLKSLIGVPNAFVSNDVEIFHLQCRMVLSIDGEDFDLKCRVVRVEMKFC
jgi:hypothetical protein